MNPVLDSGLAGVNHGLQALRKTADDIAKAGTTQAKETDVGDVAKSMVDLKESRIQVEASAKVVETASEVLGTLINTKA